MYKMEPTKLQLGKESLTSKFFFLIFLFFQLLLKRYIAKEKI